MNDGFWTWLIPLPSGVTSVGVVADPTVANFAPSDYRDLLAWLEHRDPRVYAELSAATPADDEFHFAEVDAYRAETCFSDERWAVVGGAASLVDVLYSPGADLIAVGNSLVTDLIDHELEGGRIGGRCAIAERVFGGFVDGLAELYRGQYRHFGKADQMATKVVWDSALYFGFHTLLFRHGVFGDPHFLAEIRPELLAVRALQARVQGRMKAGDIHPLFQPGESPVEWGAVSGLMDNYYGAEAQPDPKAVLDQLRRGMSTLEGMARRIERVV
jgi:flavin-dependent dehydrogenase